MMPFFYQLMGPYTWESFALGLTFLNTHLCILLFGRELKKGRCYPLRVILTTLLGIAFCCLLSVWKTNNHHLAVRIICYLLITVMNLVCTRLCYSDTVFNELLVFCAGSAGNQVSAKLYMLLQNSLGIDDRATISLIRPDPYHLYEWEWTLFIGLHILVYWVLSILFRPKVKLSEDRRTNQNVVALSVAVVFIVNILICIARVYQAESFALGVVVKLFCVGFGFVVLLSCAGILSRSEREQQLQIMTQLWKQNNVQFESVKANMDVINMKCHDLKHIIHRIEDKLTEEEVASLKEAIQFYDANIKTGNKVLDVVLCEKAMLCQKNGIQFFCMADGKKLDFLTAVQTYTLFGNIIDNAVEAVQQVDNPDNKLISLLCRETNGGLEIEESNYFDGPLVLEDNLPATTKDNPNQHGFGIKSIKYIVELYGGKLSVRVEDNMFFLNIRFPLPRH